MADEKITEESVEVDEIEAPVSAICNNAEELAADLVDADKAHSSTASNSTRSIPISQTEDAT